jgi:membrane-associated protein
MTLLDFQWMNLLQPDWYINTGGLWFIMFVVFAETGLFAGFFLPGDSLLFVAGIFSEGDESLGIRPIIESALGFQFNNPVLNLLFLGLLISSAGIIGNMVGYWFGKKSGPFLFERKDSFLFKKKYLYQAKDFYDKHGGGAIVMARFLPIVRTFAPIVAGIVQMDKKKFMSFNIIGSFAWVYSMLIAGHYLQTFILNQFNYDLKSHLEVIVIGIVFVTTAPVILKMVFGKKKSA